MAHNTQMRSKIYDTILDTIGNTPLVRVPKLQDELKLKGELLLKLEFFNPLASVKDRIGYSMINDLEESGKITKDTVLIEPTSGNTGIALAFVAAAKGYRLILCMPESMSIERRKVLKYLGAELELTPAAKGMKGAIERANELSNEIENAFIPQQFANAANPAIHESTTALEIINDTDGKFDAFVAGVGTGGTITGCGRLFKKQNLDVKIIAVEPKDSPVLSGGAPGPHKIQGIGAGFVPDIYDNGVIDEIIKIDNETSFSTSKLLARLEGIPAGISSGANLAAAIEVAKRDDMSGKQIVVIIPSFAERYISTALFDGF
ncbi:MAG: cysteine synthase A [Pseudomonadota bacterium]